MLSSLRRAVTTPHHGSRGDAAASPPEPQPLAARQQSVPRPGGAGSDWFMDLFGFREVRYEDTKRRLRLRADPQRPGAEVLEAPEAGRSYKVGRFATPSLRELQQRASALGGCKELPGKLKVVNIRGDVTEELGRAENRHATFQVASQFNCLEYVSPEIVPEYGVTMYAKDKTQGPACCVSCGPATVYRNYFAKMEGGQRGQTQTRQLNNLQQLSEKLGNEPGSKFFRVVGGYTLASDKALQRLSSELDSLSDPEYAALRQELRVGLHEDVQVTSTNWGARLLQDEEQCVTQVLGSACSVSYSLNDKDLWEPMARLVLSASYEAAFWSALLTAIRHKGRHGSKRLFLTSLGGGAFGNRQSWITDAMRESCRKFKDCGLEVFVVTYSGPFERSLEELERDFRGAPSRW